METGWAAPDMLGERPEALGFWTGAGKLVNFLDRCRPEPDPLMAHMETDPLFGPDARGAELRLGGRMIDGGAFIIGCSILGVLVSMGIGDRNRENKALRKAIKDLRKEVEALRKARD